MSVASLRTMHGSLHSRPYRAIRLAGVLTTAYLALLTLPVWLFSQASGSWGPLLLHIAALAYAVAVLASAHPRARPLLDWLVLTVGPVMYVELHWVIAGLGLPHQDQLVIRWEAILFPGNPSATFAPAWNSLLLSEALHLAYASYYLLVYVPVIALYVRGRYDAFAATMLALMLVYGACFITYALFPVDGPRYLLGAAAAPAGPVRHFVLTLLEHGSSRGTAFPSSHVAASVVSALCALQYQNRVGIVIAIIAAALTVSTVYGGFHYAVDAVAGVLLGVVAWFASSVIWRRMAAPS